MLRDRDLDTICAVSTPSGVGGISVVRVSGPGALSITKALCAFLPEKLESHHAYYGLLKSN
ncbi:MAG: tRNA uridine-5-carboxymethylaminomethyl(34) synthesis GTPase MnmE, partial [Pseudobdellovibrionaceae bacterium]